MTHTTSLMTTAKNLRPNRGTRSWALRALDWLAERDRAHRDAVRLSQLPPALLDDIGLPSAPPAAGFYTDRGNRAADRAPIYLGSTW
jgi:hypothetical protein